MSAGIEFRLYLGEGQPADCNYILLRDFCRLSIYKGTTTISYKRGNKVLSLPIIEAYEEMKARIEAAGCPQSEAR